MEQAARALRRRGFDVFICENHVETSTVVETLLLNHPTIDSISFGHSRTVESIGLHEKLKTWTQNLFIHSPVGTEAMDRKALTSDICYIIR
jgi:hypothetical protein